MINPAFNLNIMLARLKLSPDDFMYINSYEMLKDVSVNL